MRMTDSERSNALEEIDRAYRELTGVLDTLSREDMERSGTVGHWSGKDVLSHIAAWEVEGTRHIGARENGDEDAIPRQSEYDAWNEQQVAKTRDWSVEQVRAYFESAHLDFVQMVRTSDTVWPGIATGLTSHHYEEHIDQFRAMKSPS